MDIQGLKDKILQLAIQGKLVEQDKNDEPASALLQRIKEERDKLVKEGKIRKPKKLPPIEEEDKYFGIPEGWEWVRLGEVAQFINGDRGKNYPSKKELVESGIPFINAGYLNNSEIELVNMNYITDEKFESLSSGKIQIKDIIYCLRGTLGKCSINKKIEKGAIASSLVIIRNYVDIYEKYIYYYLVSPLSKYMIKKYDNGTAQPNLSAESVRQYSLPLPPLAEQKRIVEKVDELFALIDELDSNKEDLLEVINLTRNQVLQEAIQGKLVEQNPEDEPASLLLERIKEERDKLVKEGKIKKQKPLPEITEEEKLFEIPEGWEWVRLGEAFLSINNGANIKQHPSKGGYPITRIETIADSYIDRERMGYGDIYEIEGFDKYILKNGDILMSHINSVKHLGKTAYYEKRDDEIIIHGMNLLCLRSSKEALNYKYANYFFNSLTFKDSIQDIIKRAVNQASINITNLSKKILPLPPLAEQKRIVEKVDMIMNMLDELENEIVINI